MFVTAKAYFEDKTPNNVRLLIRAETAIPQEWLKRFRKNVIPLTPKSVGGGRLRRSIITQAIGNRANVSWRAPYAKAQHDGGHTVRKPIRGRNRRDGGFATIQPRFYRYHRYSTPGTGPRFGSTAYRKTNEEMPAILRELGLTK